LISTLLTYEGKLPSGKSSTEKLERVIERAIRYVFHDKDSSDHEQLTKLVQTTLLNQRLIEIVCTVFKSNKSNNAPKSINELIKLRNSTYNLRGGKEKLNLPPMALNRGDT
jgi:hypothetical protein